MSYLRARNFNENPIMRKVRILCLAGVALLFAACSKDDNPGGDDNPKPETDHPVRYISTMVETPASGGDSIVYTYNADNTLKREARFELGKTDPSYVSIFYPRYYTDGVESIFSTNNVQDATGTLAYVITHNSKGQIVTSENRSETGSPYVTSSYDADGQVIKRSYYAPQAGGAIDSSIFSLTWKNKNVEKVVIVQYDKVRNDTTTIDYLYDDKRNPMLYTGIDVYRDLFPFQYLSANNATKETWSYSFGHGYYLTYEYTYNSDKYPTYIKMTEVEEVDNEPHTLTETNITYVPVQ